MDIDESRPDLENALTPVERRLAAWRPAGSSHSRDDMLFNAGRAVGQAESRSRFWQFATAASVVVIVTFCGVLANERSKRIALESQSAGPAWPPEPWSPPPPSIRLARIEPAGPGSYLTLTAQLSQKRWRPAPCPTSTSSLARSGHRRPQRRRHPDSSRYGRRPRARSRSLANSTKLQHVVGSHSHPGANDRRPSRTQANLFTQGETHECSKRMRQGW